MSSRAGRWRILLLAFSATRLVSTAGAAPAEPASGATSYYRNQSHTYHFGRLPFENQNNSNRYKNSYGPVNPPKPPPESYERLPGNRDLNHRNSRPSTDRYATQHSFDPNYVKRTAVPGPQHRAMPQPVEYQDTSSMASDSPEVEPKMLIFDVNNKFSTEFIKYRRGRTGADVFTPVFPHSIYRILDGDNVVWSANNGIYPIEVRALYDQNGEPFLRLQFPPESEEAPQPVQESHLPDRPKPAAFRRLDEHEEARREAGLPTPYREPSQVKPPPPAPAPIPMVHLITVNVKERYNTDQVIYEFDGQVHRFRPVRPYLIEKVLNGEKMVWPRRPDENYASKVIVRVGPDGKEKLRVFFDEDEEEQARLPPEPRPVPPEFMPQGRFVPPAAPAPPPVPMPMPMQQPQVIDRPAREAQPLPFVHKPYREAVTPAVQPPPPQHIFQQGVPEQSDIYGDDIDISIYMRDPDTGRSIKMDPGLYVVKRHRNKIVNFNFEQDGLCSSIRYANKTIWKHYESEYGTSFPKYIVHNKNTDKISVNFQHFIILYQRDSAGNWNDTEYDVRLYTRDPRDPSVLIEMSKAQFELAKVADEKYEYRFKPGAPVCSEVQCDDEVVWKRREFQLDVPSSVAYHEQLDEISVCDGTKILYYYKLDDQWPFYRTKFINGHKRPKLGPRGGSGDEPYYTSPGLLSD